MLPYFRASVRLLRLCAVKPLNINLCISVVSVGKKGVLYAKESKTTE
jgi:hypothetical protein